MPCECDDKYTRNYYRYYDTPDGCDVPKKIGVAARYGIITGLIAGTYDVMMYSHAVGMGPILLRYAKHAVPLGLMGATFAIVANGIQHARETDDVWNYFAGGMACGPIAAAYLGSKHAILLGGLALGIAGILKKDSVDDGYSLFPSPASCTLKDINSWRRDYSLAKDPKDDFIHSCGQSK